jgi:hypothetical protein
MSTEEHDGIMRGMVKFKGAVFALRLVMTTFYFGAEISPDIIPHDYPTQYGHEQQVRNADPAAQEFSRIEQERQKLQDEAKEILEELNEMGQKELEIEETAESIRIAQEIHDQEQDALASALEKAIREDAEKAAATIEDLTVQLEEAISDQNKEAPQEIDELKVLFEEEQKSLQAKLEKTKDNYFEKYPDLTNDQREEAKATFKDIEDSALGALKEQQSTRMGELQMQQQDLSAYYEARRKELEGTRDERP